MMARERETPYDGMPTCQPPRVQNHPKGVHRCVLVVPGLPTNEGRQQTENQSVLAGKRMKKGPGVHCSKGIRKVRAIRKCVPLRIEDLNFTAYETREA